MATILGTSGNDFISGGFQNDLLNALAGADTMQGGKGNDIYHVDNLGDTVVEQSGEGADTVIATVALSAAYANVENYDFSKLNSGVDFTGNGLNNEIKGTSGIDTLAGGTGGDTYYVNSKQDVVQENVASGGDTIVTTFSADLADYGNVENVRLLGSAALNATGSAAGNVLEGNGGANILDGKGAADIMAGGKGNDTYYVDDASDIAVEYAGEGTDTVVSTVTYELSSNVEKLILAAGSGAFQARGNSLNNTIVGNESDNFLDGKGGADTMTGGQGNDGYVVDHIGDKIVENAGQGADDSVYSAIDFSLASLGNIEHLLLTDNAIKATGNAQSNRLYGNAEDNLLDGAAGADSLYGAQGNDTYYVDNVGDVIFEDPGNGTDTVISKIAFGTAIANVENYDFSKLTNGISFTGNELNNEIKGTGGIDVLAGGLGDDTYFLNSKQDQIFENSKSGAGDTIATIFSTDLADYPGIENIRLLGAAALNAAGSADANLLEGNSGANTLDGRGDADTLVGGKGNDTYYVDNAGDIIVEYAKEGVDTVIASITHELAPEVEKLVMAAGAGNIGGTGNALNNTIIGNEGDNSLNGKGGADTLKGGQGNDYYFIDHASDKIVEAANEGTDVVFSSVDFSLAMLGNVEYMTLWGPALKGTGNALDNIIYGNDEDNIHDTYYVDNAGDSVIEEVGAGNDTVISTIALAGPIANVENYDFSKVATAVNFTGSDLNNIIKGGSAADTLAGGLGADTYYLNSSKDTVVESAGGGVDTIAVTFSAMLADYANVENIRLIGAAALSATGNSGFNFLYGNDGANILDGKGGADFMAGGKGNDTYYVDNAADSVFENAGEGRDTVISSVDFTLADNIENLTLAAGAGDINGFGNASSNLLTGNEGKNILDGLDGADTMKGGKGDDIYFVANGGDKVIENVNEGTDQVFSTVDFTLATLSNVEHVHLTGAAIKATGNALANVIHGNDQDNTIDGGKGADTMWGGKGNDVYYIDNAGDMIVELFNEGTDTVTSTVAFGSVINDVENYDFSKLAGGVNFTADLYDNVIKGGAGVDTLAGGEGNDTYYLNSAKDGVTEIIGGGTSDTIAVSFSADLANYTEIENIRLLGTAALKATGNGSTNQLWGNTGANILDGKGGADTMSGGKGSDTYYVDNAGDLVEELGNEGTDTVISTVGHALDANVETLILAAGAGDIYGSGNALNNTIVGNESDNSLNGFGGADTLKGGKGNDAYWVDNAGDKIVENLNEGIDRVYATVSFSLATLANVEALELKGLALNATGNALDNQILGNGLDNIIDGGKGADEMIGGQGSDTYFVDNLGDEVIELPGGGTDKIVSTIALTSAYMEVEYYDFSKATSAVNFTGNSSGNQIWSSAFNDTLAGGQGGDRYHLNNTGDSVVELAGQGEDEVVTTVSVTKLWDNVENVFYQSEGSTKAWNATGNDLDNIIVSNNGANILDGGLGDDILIAIGGNDTLTGGGGADQFYFSEAGSGGPLSGHDIITDFDGSQDILIFSADDSDGDGTPNEYDDFVAGILDQGAGKDVVLYLLNGGSVTFKGIGTGSVDSVTDLVADPANQIVLGIN
jgi:Ca2+-binding RTX toxin-like protein